jgi:dCTP deaminase
MSINNNVGIRPDTWIRTFAEQGGIAPFEPQQVRRVCDRHIISYGTSSYGYDARCDHHFKLIVNNNPGTIIDPKAFDPSSFISLEKDVCIMPPNSFMLATTIEYFKLPRNVLALCVGKSTYARCGIVINVTPIEPGFEGKVTLELSNTTNLPVKIYAHEGIAQFLFLMSDTPCQTTYADRQGKYQGQKGITLPTT